jgi:colicin import membrane protein
MTGNRYTGRARRPAPEPKFGRMLLISMALHLLVLGLFTGLPSSIDPVRRPVYYVDLTRLPVADPQAGRPDARPKEVVKKPTPAAKPATVKKPTADVRPKPTAKPVTTTPPKPTAVKPGISEADISKKLAKMREEQERKDEIQALKDKLAALAATDTRGEDAAPVAPLGMPDARGDEAGVSTEVWLQAYLKEMWRLSRYQVSNLDLWCKVQIDFSADGRLLNFKFLRESGDVLFDDSVRTAVLKVDKLERAPGKFWQVEVVFNLKDLIKK